MPAVRAAGAAPPEGPLSRAELEAWGQALGGALRPPVVITLDGELGAGKTTLVQAICRGYGVTQPVTSPTFALVHEYEAPMSRVFHLDLYRLRDPRELLQLGWEEIVAAPALVLVEWAERAGSELPASRVALTLSHVPGGDDRRLVRIG